MDGFQGRALFAVAPNSPCFEDPKRDADDYRQRSTYIGQGGKVHTLVYLGRVCLKVAMLRSEVAV